MDSFPFSLFRFPFIKRRGWINLSPLTLPPPFREGWGGSYMHDVTPKVVAIAVRMVITMLRILPQRVLLLNVPIVLVRGPTLTLPVWRGRGSRDACATRRVR